VSSSLLLPDRGCRTGAVGQQDWFGEPPELVLTALWASSLCGLSCSCVFGSLPAATNSLSQPIQGQQCGSLPLTSNPITAAAAAAAAAVFSRCLSSKYFFWEPDYAWLSLGRYGALQEISWVAKQHAAGAPDFRYYYLGYYIHSCPKMAYKAEYLPSELLCPQRQVWVRFGDPVRQAFDRSPYVVLSDLPGVQMRPNLSVPRQPPAAAAAGTSAGAADAPTGNGAGGLEMRAQNLSSEQQVQQLERQALDGQLLFVMKQPVRWGALRDSGLLDDGDIEIMEEQLTAWRTVVGETARTLLYATAQDMLSF
jgi:arginine-tRNA-protein transferase